MNGYVWHQAGGLGEWLCRGGIGALAGLGQQQFQSDVQMSQMMQMLQSPHPRPPKPDWHQQATAYYESRTANMDDPNKDYELRIWRENGEIKTNIRVR